MCRLKTTSRASIKIRVSQRACNSKQLCHGSSEGVRTQPAGHKTLESPSHCNYFRYSKHSSGRGRASGMPLIVALRLHHPHLHNSAWYTIYVLKGDTELLPARIRSRYARTSNCTPRQYAYAHVIHASVRQLQFCSGQVLSADTLHPKMIAKRNPKASCTHAQWQPHCLKLQ